MVWLTMPRGTIDRTETAGGLMGTPVKRCLVGPFRLSVVNQARGADEVETRALDLGFR
jgi:hypothetical protein